MKIHSKGEEQNQNLLLGISVTLTYIDFTEAHA